jgi:hypothetical protein
LSSIGLYPCVPGWTDGSIGLREQRLYAIFMPGRDDPSRNLIRSYPFITGLKEGGRREMRSSIADEDSIAVFGSRAWNSDFSDKPEIAVLYAITGGLMEVLGPAFWAALAVLFIEAELIAG